MARDTKFRGGKIENSKTDKTKQNTPSDPINKGTANEVGKGALFTLFDNNAKYSIPSVDLAIKSVENNLSNGINKFIGNPFETFKGE